MDLSNDLISQFVKITNDGGKNKSSESIVYGTTVEYSGEIYVKIDGSDLLTPVETTADMQPGERVTIMIKNHSATVTGNITSPSANAGTVDKVVTDKVDGIEEEIENKVVEEVTTEVEKLVTDKVSTEELEAELAIIDELIAKKASITDLEVINAKIENLDVEKLEAAYADITILNSDVANIKTLVNGNLTSDNILSFHITADKVTMDDAFITDAMIANVSAGKINAGSINTDLVNIESEDGALTINGSTQQFKDSNGNVRIQIGKDASGDFTFILYGADGQGQILNQNGITASAIGDGLIVNDMIGDNAAISGGKLDISSVITEINADGSETIKSNKIYLDEQNQTLEVAFNSLKTQVETIQDITVSGDLTSVIEQVQSNTTQINICKEGITTLIGEDMIIKEQITDLNGVVVETNNTLTAKYSNLEQSVNGFKTDVAETYATQKTVKDLETNLETNYSTTATMNSSIDQKANQITSAVSETYATQKTVKDLETNLETNYSTTATMNSAIDQKANQITSAVSETYATQDEVDTVQSSLTEVTQTANKINWLVESGDNSSNMTLTENFYSVVSQNISLTAEHIDLHGYVTVNGGFSIDEYGNMSAVNGMFSGDITGSTFSSTNDIFQVLADGTIETNYLSVNGSISTDVLYVGHIYNPKYPACMSENTVVYISFISNGVTDYKDFQNGCSFASFYELFNVIPANLNGNRLDIYMETDVTENVIFDKFFGGDVYLHMQGHTINGYLRLQSASTMFRIYGNNSASTGTDIRGKIMPKIGSLHYSYYYDIACLYSSVYLYDIELYPTIDNAASTGGIYMGGGARGYVNNLYLMGGAGGLRYALRAYESSMVFIASSTGQANNATWCADSGSTVSLSPTTQAGTTATSPTYISGNGQIRSTGVTFTSTSNAGVNTGTGTTIITKTKTVNATSADTYRSTIYNSWKGDGTVRQGDYGYGDCQGCWFFGNALYEAMNAGTLTKVVIKITRQSGGVTSAQTHTLKCHNYTNKPSIAPSYSGTLTTFSCAVGATATITIEDPTMLDMLKTCKGLGLSIGSTSSPYSVCSGSCSVTVTYNTTA